MDFSISEIQPSERPALANLMKMYCYEWSQYNGFDVDDAGVYPFERQYGACFTQPNRWNYLLRADGRLAGFALIDDDFALPEPADFSMGEFFVMHKYRRGGAGRFMATRLFDLHPGRWQVGFHPANLPSVAFLTRVIADYTGNRCVLHERCPGLTYRDGTLGNVITFAGAAVIQ